VSNPRPTPCSDVIRWPLLVGLLAGLLMLAAAQQPPRAPLHIPAAVGTCRIIDLGCQRRQDAQVLHALGQEAAAVALMCQDRDVRQAMLDAGTPCPGPKPVEPPRRPVEP